MRLEECRIGRVYDWMLGMCDFMDYIGYIIFGIFIFLDESFPFQVN